MPLLGVQADAADPASYAPLREAVSAFTGGALHILVNNVGEPIRRSAFAASDDARVGRSGSRLRRRRVSGYNLAAVGRISRRRAHAERQSGGGAGGAGATLAVTTQHWRIR